MVSKVFLETTAFLESTDCPEKEETTVFPVSPELLVSLEKTESVSPVWLDTQDPRESLENPDTPALQELKDMLDVLANVDIPEPLDFLAEMDLLDFPDPRENTVFLASPENKEELVVLDWMEPQVSQELKERLDFPDSLEALDSLEREELMDSLVFL